MGNKSIWIAGALVIFIGLLFASRVNEKNIPTKKSLVINKSGGSVLSVTPEEIPLKEEVKIISTFFEYIDRRQFSNAIKMMSSAIVNGSELRYEWEAQFNAIKSIKIVSIDTSSLSTWSAQKHIYIVKLNILMDPSSASALIPYYGYSNGNNIRYISLLKEGDIWKIQGVSTGP